MCIDKVPRGSVAIVLLVVLTGVLLLVGYGLHVVRSAVHLQQREEWRMATEYASESAVNWALGYCRQYGIPRQRLQTVIAYPHPQIRAEVTVRPQSEQDAVIVGTATGPDTNRRIWLRMHTVVREGEIEVHVDEVRG